MGENPVGGGIAVPVGHAHFIGCGADGVALPVETVCTQRDIAEFAAIGTGIHPQAAANGSRNTNQEFKAGKARPCCIAGNIGVGCTGIGGHAGAVMRY